MPHGLAQPLGNSGSATELAVVDPGFGQGGKKFSQDFADVVKQANIGWGPGPALGPLKLLHF